MSTFRCVCTACSHMQLTVIDIVKWRSLVRFAFDQCN
jgi:hypothetical protein